VPDQDRLINAIDDAEEHSYGSDTDSELADARAKAINYYLGRMGAAPEGRSQVVDRTVYETIQIQRPSLSRIFAGTDTVIHLPPIGPDDEEGAKQEGEYLNYVLTQKNNWFQVFNTASMDGLLCKAGYLYAYRETRKQLELESYKRQTEEGVALIMQDQPEVVDLKEYPDPDYQPQPMMQQGPQGPVPVIGPDGQPVMQPAPMMYDLDIRRTKEEVHYCVAPLPPERVKVAESHNEVQLVNCPYFEYYDYCTISYLREMGFEVEDDISDDDRPDAIEESARDQYSQSTWDHENTVDPAMRKVKTRWIWIQHDYDEDGLSELNYVIRVGTTILHREECNEIPVGVLCPDPLPHRHLGLSSADSAINGQEISTSVLRQGMDNLYLALNPRQFADPLKVNLDDMLISRPGAITRVKSGAVFMQDFGAYPVPNVFPDAMAALEFFKQRNEDTTGVGRHFSGIDPNAINKTATEVQQVSTMSAQRVEQVARFYANGVERVCAVLHALILKGGHKKETVKLRGKWVTVDPATWRTRTDFRICVGYSAGNKDAQVNRLMLIGNMQKEAMMGGLPIVNPQNIYETALEITKASDFSNPNRFWTDPATVPPPPPPQPDVTVVAMEQIKAQSAQILKKAEIEAEKIVTQAKLEVDKYKADLASQTTLTVENWKLQNAHTLEDKRSDTTLKVKTMDARKSDDEVTGVRVRAQSAEEMAEALAKELQNAHGQVQQLAGIVQTKRRIKRGKDNKPTHVEIVTPEGEVVATQKVIFGPDGRVAGTQ
jgi:cell division septum initiation protein DivIVA